MLPLFLILLSSFIATQGADEFNVGALFHLKESKVDGTPPIELAAFEAAIQSTSTEQSDLKLIKMIRFANLTNSIQTKQIVCQLLEVPVIAIFGPQISDSSPIVKSICDRKEIPNIQTRYDTNLHRGSCGVNLYPHPKALSKAFADVIERWDWKDFIIIYEDNESLLRISDLLRTKKITDKGLKIRQLPNSDNFRPLFREVRYMKENNILLDCSIEKLPEVLQQAQQAGIMIENYNYIITCLDFYTINIEPFRYSGVNITGFRIVNPDKPRTKEILDEFQKSMSINVTEEIRVEAALIYDAVNLLKASLQELKTSTSSDLNTSVEYISDKNVPSCNDLNSWIFGSSLVNIMKVTETEGLTGLVKFDHEGFRTNVELQIIELTEDGITEKGIWNTSEGVIVKMKSPVEINSGVSKNIENTTFKVVISMTKPYGMRKPVSNTLKGNDRYEGYAVDLIDRLSKLSNFKYEFIIQADGANGQLIDCPNGTKTCWDGMVGKVVDEEADLAVADITMSKERSFYVEFSSPYMDLGIAILYMKATKQSPNLFSFLSPFTTKVWISVLAAYIGVSLQFYFMARISPYEWTNPYPCIQEPEKFENQFTLVNSFWFTIGALMQQGTEIAPISPSTRLAAVVWWFFTLIMVSSYTANLAAFLTVENLQSPFKNAKELYYQKEITYGAKANGTTANFFRDSNITEYNEIYGYMQQHPELMTISNEEGVEKVLRSNGKYAFFMESSAIDYEKERYCNLTQIGPLLDNKNYGVAMRKGTWYADTISKDILVLQEQGVLSGLKRKWWKEKYAKNCQESEKHDAQTLILENVGGVFLVLIAGTGIGFIIMMLELFLYLLEVKAQQNITIKRGLIKEIKFVAKCKSVKKLRKSGETSLLSTSEVNIS